MFSILHISDLHRSKEEPLDNNSLIAALLADRDRYACETPAVRPPDAIVVSGDIIQGARIGDPHWRTAMRSQYEVAFDFLDQLCQRFLAGDRKKLIVVPGNHDVCWNTSFGAMEKVSPADFPKDVRASLLAPDSLFRWSWKDLSLYKIVDLSAYNTRLKEYWEFFDKFYEGSGFLTGIKRDRGYQLFELLDRRIVVAAFDSISGNDCFSYAGSFQRGVIASCNLSLRDIPHEYELRIGVWHHSIQGPPLRDDYIDMTQVEEMVGLNFQIGMHGHQHVASANTHYVHLGESQSMAVVSAGSLCAGAKELPRGQDRQYNVIVFDDDLKSARVHAREMANGGQFAKKTNGAFSEGFVRLKWSEKLDVMGRLVNVNDLNSRSAILRADEALHSNDAEGAIEALNSIKLEPNSHARNIAIQAGRKLARWDYLVKVIGVPSSAEEAVILISSLIKSDQIDAAEESLKKFTMVDLGTRRGLEEKIAIKKVIKGL